MRIISTSRLMSTMLVLVFLVLVGVWLRHPLGQFITDQTGRLTAPLAVGFHQIALLVGRVVSRENLAGDDVRLSQASVQVQALTAQVAALQRQNTDLESSLGIQDRIHRNPIFGAVFSYPVTTDSSRAVLNRGSRDGVGIGDIVITPQGALVGLVAQVFTDHAVVALIGGPILQVTARLAGSSVTGLVGTDPTQGVLLDLVQKSESVAIGESVVTSGNDQFPAGLVIGTVQAVNTDNTALFQIIHLSLAIANGWDGQVLIMHP